MPVTLTTGPLSIADVVAVARRGESVTVSRDASHAMQKARAIVEAALQDGHAHYGINTGFGSLSRERIAEGDLRALQANLIRSHAAGVGETLPDDTVRAVMLLLAASLCRGSSGVRAAVAEHLVALLNVGVTPVVPGIGSVGASGDLAPLAHVALVLLGEGAARAGGRVVSGAEALRFAHLVPLVLEAREGLALINGTHLMAACGTLLIHDAGQLLRAALVAGAMSIDACRGTDAFLDPRVHALRPQPGQARVAAALRALLRGSTIIPAHRENDARVQDPYSLRCMPQVVGASMDALSYVKLALSRELAAVTDNPLVFLDPPHLVSAGNFHGMPLAIPLDTFAIALSHIAGISERRTFWLLAAREPESGLVPYLAPNPGLCSGLMIAQYTAAACVNEIIGLAMPASIANISTSAGIEDYNSFGPRAAAKARRALDLTRHVVAIELLCAAEGLERQRPLRSGDGVERAHALVRTVVPHLSTDRPPAPDIAAIVRLVESGAFDALTELAID